MMSRMCRRLLIAIALVSTIAIAQTNTTRRDLDGWGKIKWGMTAAAASTAYGSGIRAATDEEKRSHSEAILVIDRVAVGDTLFEVTIGGQGSPAKIDRVWFSVPGELKSRSGVLHILLDGLTLKYGPPTRSEDRQQSKSRIVSHTWLFPSTKIDLLLVETTAGDILDLMYEAIDKRVVGIL